MFQHIPNTRTMTALVMLLAIGSCASMPRFRTPNSVLQPPPPTANAPTPALNVPSSGVDVHEIPSIETGLASYYHPSLDGLETASGVIFDNEAMMAAHPSWPLGTRVRVKSLEKSDAEVEVLITDRGPTQENVAEGVVIDLSGAAAERIDMVEDGRVRVQVEVLEWGDDKYRKQETTGSE